jgi:hypothetical protein
MAELDDSLPVSYKESKFGSRILALAAARREPLTDTESERPFNQYDILEPQLAAFSQGSSDCIFWIEEFLGANTGPCPRFWLNQTTLRILYNVISAWDRSAPAPAFISVVHVLAAITEQRHPEFCQIASETAGFYASLLDCVASSCADLVQHALLCLANLILACDWNAVYLLHQQFDFFNQSAPLFEWDDDLIITALAFVIDQASLYLVTGDNASLILEMYRAVLSKPFPTPTILVLESLDHFLKIDPQLLPIAHKSGILPGVLSLFESTHLGVAQAALRLVTHLLAFNSGEIFESLIQNGIVQALHFPLTLPDEAIQDRAACLILRFTAACPLFMAHLLQTEIVEGLCELALNGDFRARSSAVGALAEIFACAHDLPVWERISAAGGIGAMVDLLPNVKPKSVNAILTAMSHIVSQAPQLLEEVGDDLMEIVDEIAQSPDVAADDDLCATIRSLQSDVFELLEGGEDEPE